jgi:trehalose 2-sulfotransferase
MPIQLAQAAENRRCNAAWPAMACCDAAVARPLGGLNQMRRVCRTLQTWQGLAAIKYMILNIKCEDVELMANHLQTLSDGVPDMKLYQRQFSEDLDEPPSAGPMRTILIASTPRCGSHMLGHALASTGLLGVPFEYANPANLAEWMRRLGTTTKEATFAALMSRRATANGVFSIKAHYSHCETLGGPERFLGIWPTLKVVHICRADVLRQAISYAIAKQTGVWITGQEAEQENADYDPGLIAECLDDIAVQNARWISAFAKAGITPLSIRYEDATADLAMVVKQVAHHAEVTGVDDLANVSTTTRQGHSARTEEWINRYAAERRGGRSQRRGFGRRVRLFWS